MGPTHKTMPDLIASKRCRSNMLRMGHCAPTVMRTLLEERDRLDLEMVRDAGGLAGGIGGPGECGGVVAPLMMLGLLHGEELSSSGVPRVLCLGQEYLRRFHQVHGGTKCKDVMPKGMRACYNAMCLSPPLFAEVSDKEQALVDALPEETRIAYVALLAAMREKRFHCAHDVLRDLSDVVAVTDDMRRASFGFVGGMALTGSTCGALAAGVTAVSSKLGGVEDSLLRVLRMLATMAFSEERAMRDERNAANRAIRIAGALARWFEKEYGTTRCAELTHADFASLPSVEKFCADGLTLCMERARRVAVETKRLIAEERRGS
jgi:C_GCAxxG_C_C family probable redox protein